MNISEASIKLSIPRYYIVYWKKIGLISSPESTDLDFSDLLKIRFIYRCKKNQISIQKIRSVLKEMDEIGDKWHENLFITPGILLKKEQSLLLEPFSDQIYFEYHYKNEGNVLKLWGNRKESSEITKLEDLYLKNIDDKNQGSVKKILKQILQLQKDHIGALIESGNIAFEENDLESALKFYGLAEENDKNCVEAIYNIANIYFRQKKYAAAIRNFHRCIDLDPDFPESYYNLGLVYYSLKYFERAMVFLKMYTEMDPDSIWTEQAKIFMTDMQDQLSGSADNDLLDF